MKDQHQRGYRTIDADKLGGWKGRGDQRLGSISITERKRHAGWRHTFDILRNKAAITQGILAANMAGDRFMISDSVSAKPGEFILLKGANRSAGRLLEIEQARKSIRLARISLRNIKGPKGFIASHKAKTIHAWRYATTTLNNSHRSVTLGRDMVTTDKLNVLHMGNRAFINYVRALLADATQPFIQDRIIPIDWHTRLDDKVFWFDKAAIPLAVNRILTLGGIAVFEAAVMARWALAAKEGHYIQTDTKGADADGEDIGIGIGYYAASTHTSPPIVGFAWDMDDAVKLAKLRIFRKLNKRL
jgi:hypothetical protein